MNNTADIIETLSEKYNLKMDDIYKLQDIFNKLSDTHHGKNGFMEIFEFILDMAQKNPFIIKILVFNAMLQMFETKDLLGDIIEKNVDLEKLN
jgi:hypothetical protein